MDDTLQNQLMLQNFMNNSSEAYVPPEIEQRNRIDTYNEIIGQLNPYYQQDAYNAQRKENIDIGKKAQELYDQNIEIAEQKIKKLENKRNKIIAKNRLSYQEALKLEKNQILNGKKDDKINNVTRSFVKFVTERYNPEKRKKNKDKQYVFDQEIKIDEKYTKREWKLENLDYQKIKDGPYYQYQIANYCDKNTVVFWPDEIWIPLYDIPDIYLISTYGRLYNKKLKYLVRPIYVEYTALYFVYYPGTTPRYERRKSESIAKMVLQSFCPIDDPVHHTVIYVDGDKRNFHLSNLKWKTKDDKEVNMRQVDPGWFDVYSKCNGRQTKYLL